MNHEGQSTRAEAAGRRRSRRILIGFVLALVLGFATFQFLVVPYRIRGRSMEPTLRGNSDGPQDIVLVNRLAYVFGPPQRWDIVVLRSPESEEAEPPTESVKRIVGLPGETVEIRDGRIYIDGQGIPRPDSVLEQATVSKGPYGSRPVQLGQREYFVLGDHSYLSLDSRAYGPIGRQAVRGRVELIVLPWERFGRPR